jgi:hypothetical protein
MHSNWVKEEYVMAISNEIRNETQRRIIPVILKDAQLPSILQNRQWVDFRNDREFEKSLQTLIWGIKGAWPAQQVPEGQSRSLEQTMIQAKNSLVISGHTLDKFSQDPIIRKTIGNLINENIRVTLIFLNPYSDYAKAHEPFHYLESRSSAMTQIEDTIKNMKEIHECFRSSKFEVYLSNYMPRFRTILIDDKYCYIRLYMFGRDVQLTPEFKLSRTEDGLNSCSFNLILESINDLLHSNHVIPLIKDGRFNNNWENSKIKHIIGNCLETKCCMYPCNRWDEVREIILGYQNNNKSQLAYSLGICNTDYKPGTFTLNDINSDAEFLQTPVTFDEWLDKVFKDELDVIKKSEINMVNFEPEDVLFQKIKTVLEIQPQGKPSLKKEIWIQEYSDIIRRLIMTFVTGNPDFDIKALSNLTVERKDFMLKVIDRIEKHERPTTKDWLKLSVAAGLLGINEKPIHAATSNINYIKGIVLNDSTKDETMEINRVSDELWKVAHTRCRIDASDLFIDMIKNDYSPHYTIISFPDDYLETIILLKYYNELINNHKITIKCIPRSVKCGNDATYDDIKDLLQHFPNLKDSGRFIVLDNGPRIGGVNLLKLSPEIMNAIVDASIIDVRGARNYEMMQGLNKDAFFGFMVCREISESVTGFIADECPFIYIHQKPGEYSFEGFTLRHNRIENGYMFAKVTVKDNQNKWVL